MHLLMFGSLSLLGSETLHSQVFARDRDSSWLSPFITGLAHEVNFTKIIPKNREVM